MVANVELPLNGQYYLAIPFFISLVLGITGWLLGTAPAGFTEYFIDGHGGFGIDIDVQISNGNFQIYVSLLLVLISVLGILALIRMKRNSKWLFVFYAISLLTIASAISNLYLLGTKDGFIYPPFFYSAFFIFLVWKYRKILSKESPTTKVSQSQSS